MRRQMVLRFALVAGMLAACAADDAVAADRQACEAIGRAVSAFVDGRHEEAVAAAISIGDIDEPIERTDLLDAVVGAAFVGQHAEVGPDGVLVEGDFLEFLDAIHAADSLCIRYGLI